MKGIALLTVLVLFWSQWAVAMHACAGLASAAPTQTISHASHDCDCPTEDDSDGANDHGRSALCKQHCETSGTSGAQQQVKPVVADQLPLQVAATIPPTVVPSAESHPLRVVALSTPPIPDPPFLRSLVLLI